MNIYRIRDTGLVTTEDDIRASFGGRASLPFPLTLEACEALEIDPVRDVGAPATGQYQHVAPNGVEQNDEGEWVTAWLVTDFTADEIAAAQAQAAIDLQAGFTTEVQARLDAFAGTRGYDGIVSLCTYVTSTNPQFAAEAQRGVDLRDQTWAAGYALIAAVQAGTTPLPASVPDAIAAANLPELTWEA